MIKSTSYQHLSEDQIPTTKLNCLLNSDIELDEDGNLHRFNPNNRVLNSQEYFVSLERLAESLQNEKGSQYGIIPGRVLKVLFDKPNGLFLTQKLLQHIEVGVVIEDLNSAPNFDDVEIVITAGRHRLVSILTLLYYAKLDPYHYMQAKIRVDVRGFETEIDMLKAIISDNSSRTMKTSEKSRVYLTYVHSQTSDEPINYADVCNKYDQAGISFAGALAEMLMMHQEDNGLFLNEDDYPLSSASFERICASYVSKKGLTKKYQSSEKLMKLFRRLVDVLPEIAKNTPTGKSGSVSGNSYTAAISEKLQKAISI
jgi:hypothetical protein